MIKKRHTRPYERNMSYNNVECSTLAGTYCITHDAKVPFCMPELSIRNRISHRFQVDNDEIKLGIGYAMIIGHDLMVKLGLLYDFKHKVLQWYGVTATTKESSGLIGQTYLNIREMHEVVMQIAEPAYTREATESLLKILVSTYAKGYLEQVANSSTQLNFEEITQLINLLEDFKDLFDGNLGDRNTEPAYLELNPYSKPFNCKHYPAPIITKDNF